MENYCLVGQYMAEVIGKAQRPVPRVVLGPLKTATQVRCAFRRLGQAILDQKIPPKVGSATAYCVAGAARALELETAERVCRQLDQLAELAYRQPRNGSSALLLESAT